VAMVLEGTPIGLLGFASVAAEKNWSEETIGLLKIAADIFANTGGVMEAALRTAWEIVTGKELPFENLHVKPIAGTAWCEAPHFQYQVSGRLHIQMADGTSLDSGPGDVTVLPSGHDAWVVGNEPVVAIDWHGASHYAKK